MAIPSCGLGSTSILVVDDDPDALDLFATCLERVGASVERASTAEVALTLLSTWIPDVVLCDLHLPHVDGYAFLEAVRASPALRALPLIAISGSHPEIERDRSLRVGFARHVTKPARLDEVIAAVQGVLAERMLTPSLAPAGTSARTSGR